MAIRPNQLGHQCSAVASHIESELDKQLLSNGKNIGQFSLSVNELPRFAFYDKSNLIELQFRLRTIYEEVGWKNPKFKLSINPSEPKNDGPYLTINYSLQ